MIHVELGFFGFLDKILTHYTTNYKRKYCLNNNIRQWKILLKYINVSVKNVYTGLFN